MSGIKHRDVPIKIDEGPKFDEGDYKVDGNGKVVYKAASKHGKSFSTEPKKALDGAKEQIDKALDKK